jgi:hypothetical protein
VSGCFAILPDISPSEGTDRPLALFENLEDALAWGAKRYSGGAFRVRYMQLAAGDALPATGTHS